MTLDDAPILTRSQIAALEHIDEESDHGELWAMVTGFHVTVLKNLEKRGFIELRQENGEMWAMPTDDGLEATIWHIADDSVEASIERGYRIRKVEKLEQKRQEMKKLSAWEKQARENLSEKQVSALEAIWDVGNVDWCDVDIHHQTRIGLLKYGYIEYENGRYRITQAGLNQLEVEQARIRERSVVVDNGDSIALQNPIASPPMDSGNSERGEAADVLEHCDTCAGCVEQEILHMLAAKYPAIARLRQTVLETRRLMDELGIEKK